MAQTEQTDSIFHNMAVIGKGCLINDLRTAKRFFNCDGDALPNKKNLKFVWNN